MNVPALTRTVQWRGRSVAWDCFGDGPPLVFLHGARYASLCLVDVVASRPGDLRSPSS